MKALSRLVLLGVFGVGQASIGASAAEPFGLYVGGAAGSADINVDQSQAGYPATFDRYQSGWKVELGIRPISVLGAQIEYVDLGHATGSIYDPYQGPTTQIDSRIRGGAAFAVGYLPLPLPFPFWDVYGKAGFARLRSSVAYYSPGVGAVTATCVVDNPPCGGGSYTRSDNRFAWGVGTQVRLPVTSLRIFTEYERFGASGDNSSLASVGLTFGF